MKKLLQSTLAGHLIKQRYPYLWEIKLFPMIESEAGKKFKAFCLNAIGPPKAAICFPQHPFKKSGNEIIAFIEEIQKNEKQVCVVVAHAHYNPLDLQAVYVLDCEVGKESECFLSVFLRWEHCSELYFLAMDVYFIAREVIASNPKPNKWKFFKRIIHMLKGHDKDLIFQSNIYGDTITAFNGKRSFWECPSCGGTVLKDELYE